MIHSSIATPLFKPFFYPADGWGVALLDVYRGLEKKTVIDMQSIELNLWVYVAVQR